MQLAYSPQIFYKYSSVNHREHPPSESRAVLYGRTDRHDEASSRFCRFCDTRIKTVPEVQPFIAFKVLLDLENTSGNPQGLGLGHLNTRSEYPPSITNSLLLSINLHPESSSSTHSNIFRARKTDDLKKR